MPDFWKLYEEYEKERLRTENTRDHYRHVIRSMEEYVEKDFFCVAPSDADIYAAQFETGNLSQPLSSTGDVRIRILKSVGTYMETKVSGYISPFTHLVLNKRERYKRSDLVSMDIVAEALAEAKRTDNHRAFVAITLALKMCLSPVEILRLNRLHFFTAADNRMFLNVPASEEYKERTIPVPADVITVIEENMPAFFEDSGDRFLICNEKTGAPISKAGLWKIIRFVTDNIKGGQKLTLQNVRTFGIALLAQEPNELSEVVAYSGIHAHNAYLYEGFKRKPIELTSMPHITVHMNGDPVS